jgi:hypothetical protein
MLLTFLREPAPLPDLVVTGYEPATAWIARRRGLRSVGIGHLYAFAWASPCWSGPSRNNSSSNPPRLPSSDLASAR